MKKILGITLFLLVLYAALLAADPGARSLDNHLNLARRIGLYGTVSLGVGLLIISGGIDLSIGSVVGLTSTLCAILLVDYKLPPPLAFLVVLAVGALIGLVNGLLVTKLQLQAFVVTLCGLFVYRGAARWLAADQVKGLGTGFKDWKQLLYLNQSGGETPIPMAPFIFLGLLVVSAVLLHASVAGRYLYAIGSNERAARYSGVATDRYKVLAYVWCSTLAAVYGILILMQENSAQPSSTGDFLELYAIAGAVLGGCSLRGGEGSVPGILIGASILVLLPNFTTMWGIPQELERTVIGAALLLGAILDEVLRRRGRPTV